MIKTIKLLFTISLFAFLFSCSVGTGEQKVQNSDSLQQNTGSFGEAVNESVAKSSNELPSMLKEKDSLQLTLSGKIESSCTGSGCWMEVVSAGKELVHVTFKDGKFTIPLDAAGKNAVFTGMATKEIKSVELLKKEAQYDNKTPEEINLITVPDTIYNFEATGVFLK